MSLRPRRSILYMPGANARALDKARGLPADSIVMDLEDAVAPDAKLSARAQVREALLQDGYGARERVVRINPPDSEWFDADLMAFADTPVQALCLPKVTSPDTLTHCQARMAEAGYAPSVSLWAMIETPAGLQHVDAICAAGGRLSVLLMGTSDLAKELRVSPLGERPGLLYSLSRCVVAGRANGLDVIDGVWLDLEDATGFARCCEQALALGFDGKSLIHPKQVAEANRVFAPDTAAVDQARRVLEAWAEAESQNRGVAVLDGKLVEVLHAEEARRTLALHEAITSR